MGNILKLNEFQHKKEHMLFNIVTVDMNFVVLFYHNIHIVFICKRYKFRNQGFRAPTGVFITHGVWRACHSDWSEYRFIMTVYEKMFLKFSQIFLYKARLKNSHRQSNYFRISHNGVLFIYRVTKTCRILVLKSFVFIDAFFYSFITIYYSASEHQYRNWYGIFKLSSIWNCYPIWWHCCCLWHREWWPFCCLYHKEQEVQA